MRLRVLVSAGGTPLPPSGDPRRPFDVLDNGIVGARWTVAHAHETDVPLNEGRTALLRALQARVGTPAQPLQQVLVRLPRRLSGPRLHGGPISIGAWQHVPLRCEERGNDRGWSEAIRWLRGRLPTAPERVSLERLERAVLLTGVDLVPAGWELSFERAGLGLPTPQRYPRRTRSRRGRSRKQRRLEVELGLRPSFGQAMSAATGLPEHVLLPNSEAVAHKLSRVVAEGAKARFATIERPFDEAPELPRPEPNDPDPRGVEPVPSVVVDRFELDAHLIRIRGGATSIAARSPARARDLAARGYRGVVERFDGVIQPLPPGLTRYTYFQPGEHIRTVVLDLTGSAPSIEIPEFDYSAIVPIEFRHEQETAVVGLRGDSGPARQARAILDTLRAWEPFRPILNLRVETDRDRRQIPCFSWVVRDQVAVFRLRDP